MFYVYKYMRNLSIRKEEILYYMIEEWRGSLKTNKNGLWLTIRALQLKLKDRGIGITWPTLAMRLGELLLVGSVEKIKTSAGECWKPSKDSFQI